MVITNAQMAKIKAAFPIGRDKPRFALPEFTVGPRPATEQGRREQAQQFIEAAKRFKLEAFTGGPSKQ